MTSSEKRQMISNAFKDYAKSFANSIKKTMEIDLDDNSNNEFEKDYQKISEEVLKDNREEILRRRYENKLNIEISQETNSPFKENTLVYLYDSIVKSNRHEQKYINGLQALIYASMNGISVINVNGIVSELNTIVENSCPDHRIEILEWLLASDNTYKGFAYKIEADNIEELIPLKDQLDLTRENIKSVEELKLNLGKKIATIWDEIENVQRLKYLMNSVTDKLNNKEGETYEGIKNVEANIELIFNELMSMKPYEELIGIYDGLCYRMRMCNKIISDLYLIQRFLRLKENFEMERKMNNNIL